MLVHPLPEDSSCAKAADSQRLSPDDPSLLSTGGHPCLLKLLFMLICVSGCHKTHACKIIKLLSRVPQPCMAQPVPKGPRLLIPNLWLPLPPCQNTR